jgi:hypothetical protein
VDGGWRLALLSPEEEDISRAACEHLRRIPISRHFGGIKPDGQVDPGPASILRPQRLQVGDGSKDRCADFPAFKLPLQFLTLGANHEKRAAAKLARNSLRKT